METLRQDLRQALRAARANKAVSAAVIGTLALAIGANAAIFSIVNSTVLRPLPFVAPERLVWMTSVAAGRSDAPFSLPELIDYQRQGQSLEGLAAYGNWSANLTGEGDPERMQGLRVSADLFDILGVTPAAGRLLRRSDDEANAAHVVVISRSLWLRRFGGQTEIIGRSLLLNSEPYTVVGVMPASLALPVRDVDVAIPLAPDRDPWRDLRSSPNFLRFIARVRTGLSVRQAQSELDNICARLRAQFPLEYGRKRAVRLLDLHSAVAGDTARILILLLCAVAVVLVVACTNLANILMLRASEREREMAIRVALGGTAPRLMRQLLTETMVLALVGGALGIVVASTGLKALVAAASAALPSVSNASMDWRVLLFTAALTVSVAIALGIVPLLATRVAPGAALRGSRSSTASRRKVLARSALVVIETACALTLLIGGGLLGESMSRLQAANLGFDPHGVFIARVSLPRITYVDRARISAFMERLESRLREGEGIREVGAISVAPFSGLLSSIGFLVSGTAPQSPGDYPTALYRTATPGYFDVLHIQLLAGRSLTDQDRSATRRVVVISKSLADQHFPNASAVGRHLTIDPGTESSAEVEVVGVVADVAGVAAETSPPPTIYVAAQQIIPGEEIWIANNQYWMVRTMSNPELFESQFRSALKEIEPDAAASNAGLYDNYVAGALGPRRFNARLMLLFACVATLLAGAGLFSVVSYSVAQRRSEIALRMALGATRPAIIRLISREGLAPVIVGGAIGSVAALGLGRSLTGMLYEVRPFDPIVFLSAIAVLLVVAIAALALPAWRAAMVESLTSFSGE